MNVYELRFGRHALRQWKRLDLSVRKQFVRKLEKVLLNPHIASARLHGFKNSYRLKLAKAGYRLGYRVHDDQLIVVAITVGPRDKDEIYKDFAHYYHEGEL